MSGYKRKIGAMTKAQMSAYNKRKNKARPTVVAKICKRVIRAEAEHKYNDYIPYGNINLANPIFIHLTAISDGNTVSTRSGNKIKLISINVKIWFHQNTSSNYGLASGDAVHATTAKRIANNHNAVRIVIFRDNRPASQTADPAYANIFQAAAGSSADVFSPINMPLAGRFTIIKDSFIGFDNIIGSQSKIYKYYSKRSDMVHYTGTNASNNREHNQFYVCLIGADDTDTIGYHSYCRIMFTDI